MTERIERFQVGGSPTVQVRLPVGSIRFIDGAEGEVLVRLRGRDATASRVRVEQTGDDIEIYLEPGRIIGLAGVEVIVEAGTAPAVRARLGSGDLSAGCDLAELQVDTASGDINVGRIAGDATVRSASGDIRIGSVGGRFQAASASGDVRVGRVDGAADAKTASGEIRIERARRGLKAKSASGDITVGALDGGDVDAKALSGDVAIGVPPGRTLEVNLDSVAGKVTTGFEVSQSGSGGEDDGGGVSTITVRTISGDIQIGAARGA